MAMNRPPPQHPVHNLSPRPRPPPPPPPSASQSAADLLSSLSSSSSLSSNDSYAAHLFYARHPEAAHVPTSSRFTITPPTTTPFAMPRPQPPPTPASSSDICGKDGRNLTAPTSNLPPTAFQQPDPTDRASASTTPSANESDSSYRPVSPPSPANNNHNMPHSKRLATSSGPVITKEDFALPPPPTRSRKIIQMKPKDAEHKDARLDSAATSPDVSAKTPAATAQGGGSGKRKQNNATSTAAGRKIARKTAHSLIERRRRSKMNEEFGVLKDMIPACQGQEMHKLAILQASIDYLRYLEQCVTDLQAQNKSPHTQAPPVRRQEEVENDEEDEDEEMEDDNEPDPQTRTPTTLAQDASSSIVALPPVSQLTSYSSTTTPATTGASPVFSQQQRNYSISSASQASYSPYFHSTQTSPAFGPQMTYVQNPPIFSTTFGLGSPALGPIDSSTNPLRHMVEGTSSDRRRSPTSIAPLDPSSTASATMTRDKRRSEQELDQEATAALLMLNSDRRSWRASQSSGNGGMSVKDLLSG